MRRSQVQQRIQWAREQLREEVDGLYVSLLQQLGDHVLMDRSFEDVFCRGNKISVDRLRQLPGDAAATLHQFHLSRRADRLFMTWIPIAVASLFFLGLAVYFVVSFANARQNPLWEVSTALKKEFLFPGMLLCSTGPLEEILCFFNRTRIPDCVVSSFVWQQVQSYSVDPPVAWNCSLLVISSDFTAKIAQGSDILESSVQQRLDILFTSGPHSLLSLGSFDPLPRDEIPVNILEEAAPYGLTVEDILSFVTASSISYQILVPQSTSLNSITVTLTEVSFLSGQTVNVFQSVLQTSSFSFPVMNGLAETGMTMRLNSPYTLQYQESYSQGWLDLLVALSISTGAGFSVLNVTTILTSRLWRKWRDKHNPASKLFCTPGKVAPAPATPDPQS